MKTPSLFIFAALAACSSHEQKSPAPAPAAQTSLTQAPPAKALSHDLEALYPDWIIKSVNDSKGRYKLSDIIEYTYKGKNYYAFPTPPCCDVLTPLYGDDGKVVCQYGTGFSGKSDKKCDEFMSHLQGRER